MRSKFVGIRGCAVCGGHVNVEGKTCRKCFWAAFRKAKEAMAVKNPYRHLAEMSVTDSSNARYM